MTHIKIHNKGNKYDVGGGTSFDSLEELIEHYKKCPLVEVSGNVVHLKQVGGWSSVDNVIVPFNRPIMLQGLYQTALMIGLKS